ncbi:MAG: PaaI family thioesterase [Microthrixaceae bacterium]|nr:PaaI family thioesterase [Microthrixaceae bacterium]
MAKPTGEIGPEEINSAVREAFAGAPGALCTAVGRDFAVVQLDVVPSMARPGRAVSGPSQFSIADAALWFLTFGVIGRVELMAVTSHLDISFLRPAAGETLSARAELLSAGSRNIVGSVKVWCDDREDAPCSVAKGTYVLPRT